MVFGIVQGHQGFLTIESAAGHGTCVGLYLPRLESTTAVAARRPTFEAGQVIEPEATPGRTILVVDDEEAVLDVVCRFLEIAGHRVIGATSGPDALEQLRRVRDIDMVILDLMMPREDGLATLQRLRQLRPRVPVLLCSGLPQAQPLPDDVTRGASLLRKPFKMNELWYAVRQALADQWSAESADKAP
jgi:CheY-like chemotaxis protein